MMTSMFPFSIKIPDCDIDDLQRRLGHTRWPDTLAGRDWKYGTDLDFLRHFVRQWAEAFDWRAVEAEVNTHEQFVMKYERTDLHFIRMNSGSPRAIPLLLCHGWPSSFLEMMDLGQRLSSMNGLDPAKDPAFDVIIPSLPGFAFSKPKPDRPWDLYDYSDCLFQLMTDLGYERFAVHAYDVASSIMSLGAFRFPERLIAYHTTEPGIPMPSMEKGAAPLTENERCYIGLQKAWEEKLGAYMPFLRTKPQTVAYGLSDSPTMLAAWMLEKWQAWTHPERPLEELIPLKHLLAQASLFWFTNSFNAANRVYLRDENSRLWLRTAETKINVPFGVTLNATQAIEHAPREYVARTYSDIRYWEQLPEGGHFIACEKPALLARSIRSFLSGVLNP